MFVRRARLRSRPFDRTKQAHPPPPPPAVIPKLRPWQVEMPPVLENPWPIQIVEISNYLIVFLNSGYKVSGRRFFESD